MPLTERMVEAGSHVFGGLALRAKDCSVVAAGGNDRVENPIYHGEIDTLRRFFAFAERREPRAVSDVRLGDCVSRLPRSLDALRLRGRERRLRHAGQPHDVPRNLRR